jgi:tRNA(adenine34) deaminase
LGAPFESILVSECGLQNIKTNTRFSIQIRNTEATPEMNNSADEQFMRLALAEAEKAASVGETPVGAVLVIDGTVVSTAHNRRETWQDPVAHAELLAIREASARLGRWRLPDATLYVTLEPCLMCAGALVLARVGRLVYGCRDPKAGALGSVYDVVRDGRLNHTYRITPGVLEAECSGVLVRFFTRLREKRPHEIAEQAGK